MGFSRQKKFSALSFKLGVSSIVISTIGLTTFISVIFLKIIIALNQVPSPQAILVLEGNPNRVEFAAWFARSHPSLKIWVSGNPDGLRLNRSIFQRLGISDQRIHYDLCAVDTVTNFTCTVEGFATQDIRHLYLITSDYHMARSRAIAAMILGNRGIVVTPVSVPSDKNQSEERTQSDSLIRTLRDCIRALVWIVTGRSGASLNPDLNTQIVPATPSNNSSGIVVNFSNGVDHPL